MSKGSNAVVYALVCGLVFFMGLPHALAALDRWRFLRRLRRAFESGGLQPSWPPEAAMCPGEIENMGEAWINLAALGNDPPLDLVSQRYPWSGSLVWKWCLICALIRVLW
jgi:hypothetical protein